MIKSGAECKSGDEDLGVRDTVGECADACLLKSGCNFFIYGTGGKAGECWWEKTSDASCPEDWEEDQYDFYEIINISKLAKDKFNRG